MASNKIETIILTREELERMLNNAYNNGFEDGSQSVIPNDCLISPGNIVYSKRTISVQPLKDTIGQNSWSSSAAPAAED